MVLKFFIFLFASCNSFITLSALLNLTYFPLPLYNLLRFIELQYEHVKGHPLEVVSSQLMEFNCGSLDTTLLLLMKNLLSPPISGNPYWLRSEHRGLKSFITNLSILVSSLSIPPLSTSIFSIILLPTLLATSSAISGPRKAFRQARF